MPIDLENFYSQDEQKYLIQKNKEFFNWYYQQKIENNYHSYLTLEQMQGFINKITEWYMIKYPDAYFDKKFVELNQNELERHSTKSTIEQLKMRLTPSEIETIDCSYRSSAGYTDEVDGEIINYIAIYLPKFDNPIERITIFATKDGIVRPCDLIGLDLKEISHNKNVCLEEIFRYLQKNSNNLNLTELEKCIYNKKIDYELRDKLISLSALALLYQKDTNPKYSMLRAHKLLNEMKEYYQIEFSHNELDKIIETDYSKISLEDKVINKDDISLDKDEKTSILKKIKKIIKE